MKKYYNIALAILLAVTASSIDAARVIDLKNQKISLLNSFLKSPIASKKNVLSTTIEEMNRYVDVNGITHIRMNEYYRNYPIWNAQLVVHVPPSQSKYSLSRILSEKSPSATMNGKLYQQLEIDLSQANDDIFKQKQAEKAVQNIKQQYLSYLNDCQKIVIESSKSQLLVYIDQRGKAHWAYQIDLNVPAYKNGMLPSKPRYIVDAVTFVIYQHWDKIKTGASEFVAGGGFGGNIKIGKLSYDGSQTNLPSFRIRREKNICYFQNEYTNISHYIDNEIMHFPCPKKDSKHNDLYWSDIFDSVNHGYSPANDVMFATQIIRELYSNWYHVPALINSDGSEMKLNMRIHASNLDNASWDEDTNTMVIGDGYMMYPLTSLGVIAHEVSHGFTDQHSSLLYEGQSGGINEAFSDMAAQAAEYYIYGKSSWQLGAEFIGVDGEALRFMDQPSKDCHGYEPGSNCSIDSFDQYYEELDVHESSGVYNRAFYILSHMPNWDVRKAFAVMLQANASYWLKMTNFAEGAACAVQAAEDLHYDKFAVEKAFKTVGISVPAHCVNRTQI